MHRFGIRGFGNSEFGTRFTFHVSPLLPIWTLLLIALLASADVWGPGIVNTPGSGDSPFLLQRLHQMVTNLRSGIFPTRWMPDAAYGLGYPFFNHYSALPFYLAAAFNLLGIDPLTALKLTQTLGFVFAALAMYGWVYHLWKHRAAAWLAAAAYTVAPFHLVNVYARGDSLSEFYAFIFFPLVLWALEKAVEKPEPGSRRSAYWKIGGLALAYAGLVLSHNISAFIFTPFASLYLISLVWQKRPHFLKPLSLGLTGLLLGAALSAWAWMPALLERDYVQAETLTAGYFDYANHFRADNLIQPGLLFDYSPEVTIGGPSPFAMGGPQAVVATVGVSLALGFALGRRRRVNGETGFGIRGSSPWSGAEWDSGFGFLVGGLLLSTLMITSLSRPLWDHLPLLPMVQFPWRFLSVQALFAAIAAGVCVLRLKGRWTWIVGAPIATLLAASTLLPLQPERLLIGPNDVTTTRLQEYELFTGNIGTTIRYEWLPRAADPRPFTSDWVIDPGIPPPPIPMTGALVDATQTQHRPTEQTWRVQAGESGATLAFPLLYWPGWRAWVDGDETRVWAVEGAGYLTLDVPGGAHTVRLKLERTPLRARAETLSLATLLVLLAAALWQARPYYVMRIAYCVIRNTHYALRITFYALPLLIGLLILLARSSPPPNRLDDLTMDFVQLKYLHHNPDGVPFGDDQARLLSYTLSSDQITPGETLTVTLKWDNGQLSGTDSRITVRLVSPAEQLPNSTPTYVLARDATPLGETTVHWLDVPENIPRGVYLLQVRFRGPDGYLFARTPLGETRDTLYLRPVRVAQGAPVPPDAPVLAQVGPDIRLHAAQLEPGPLPTDLKARLEWSTERRLAANYRVSLRLLAPDGREWSLPPDSQPGDGFLATSLWRPGERIEDRYTRPLPNDVPAGDGYRLQLIFYQPTAEIGRAVVGPFALPVESPVDVGPPPRLFELPPISNTLDVVFGDPIRLAGYNLTQDADALDLTLWWVAQSQPQKNYTVFVHLFDTTTGGVPVQHDAMPRGGSYPTTRWLRGEVVSDTIRLSLNDVPPGNYQLAVGLYDARTGERLPAIASDGALLPDSRLVLPDVIDMPENQN